MIFGAASLRLRPATGGESNHTSMKHESNLGLERLFYTVPEVAVMLAVSNNSIYRLLERGLLKSSCALRHKRITRESISEFVRTTVE